MSLLKNRDNISNSAMCDPIINDWKDEFTTLMEELERGIEDTERNILFSNQTIATHCQLAAGLWALGEARSGSNLPSIIAGTHSIPVLAAMRRKLGPSYSDVIRSFISYCSQSSNILRDLTPRDWKEYGNSNLPSFSFSETIDALHSEPHPIVMLPLLPRGVQTYIDDMKITLHSLKDLIRIISIQVMTGEDEAYRDITNIWISMMNILSSKPCQQVKGDLITCANYMLMVAFLCEYDK